MNQKLGILLFAIMYRYSNEPAVTGDLSTFTDGGKVNDYAVNAMIWAVSS